jgi:transcriptional regulator
MFIPKSFEVTDSNLIFEWLDLYSFATLVSSNSDRLTATHLPLLVTEDKSKLIGHMARNNDQWKELSGREGMAIFQGPHHYISPSWYETKDAVPTWNYISVHVYGKFQILEQEDLLIESLARLTQKYESSQSNYQLKIVESQYLASLRKGIIGFEMNIQKIEAKAKLSQNHSVTRQKLVITELEKLQNENALAIASWMREILNPK